MELRDVLSEDGTYVDVIALDLVPEIRAAIVRDLAMHWLPVASIKDLRDRIAMYRETGIADPQFEEALFRDVERDGRDSKGLSVRTEDACRGPD